MSTPGYSPAISTGGLSSVSSGSLAFSLTDVLSRKLASGKRKQLSQVIKSIKYALKAYELAMKSRSEAFATLRNWSTTLKDEATKEMVYNTNSLTSWHWNGDSEFVTKMKMIISRLQELRQEELQRDKIQRALKIAEKSYYKGLYKSQPTSEIESLEQTCKLLRLKAESADIDFQQAVSTTLSQCLAIFCQQIGYSADLEKKYAARVLDTIDRYDIGPIGGSSCNTSSYSDANGLQDNLKALNSEETHKSPSANKQQEETVPSSSSFTKGKVSPYQRIAQLVSGKKSLKVAGEGLYTNKSNEPEEGSDIACDYEKLETEPLECQSNNPFASEYGFQHKCS